MINQEKPKTLFRNQNDVTVCWKNVFNTEEKSNDLFKLQIQDDIKEWKTIYLGENTEFKIVSLAPGTCYNLRVITFNNNLNNWIYFKSATDDTGPYNCTMHMTRAVKLGKTHVIRKIANFRPILLNVENKENKTPIVQAIEAGNINVLQLLINLGANVNRPLRFNKRTALMIAVYKGQLQMATLLLDKGANPNVADVNNLNILHYAVDSNNAENLKFAVQLGLDINAKDNQGWTPLLRAVILNCSQEVIEFLVSHGAKKNVLDKNGFDYDKHRKLNCSIFIK